MFIGFKRRAVDRKWKGFFGMTTTISCALVVVPYVSVLLYYNDD